MIGCLKCFQQFEPFAKKMITNTMAMMVMRDATLDDITVVIFIMWYMKLLLSLTPTLVDILGLRSKLAKKSCDKREGPFETNLWSILRGSRFLRLCK